MSVGVCIVGSGRAGSVHAVNIHRYLAQAHVAAVVDADSAKADALAGQVGGPPASFVASSRSLSRPVLGWKRVRSVSRWLSSRSPTVPGSPRLGHMNWSEAMACLRR